MTPTLLQLFPLADPARAALAERFALVDGTTRALRDAAIARDGLRIDAVLTTGGHGLTAAEMDAMPTLRFVGAFGVGYEGIDLDAARARGIVVVNGPGVNDDSVADHALALLLGAIRRVRVSDLAVRAGIWRDDLPDAGQLAGRRVGLFGYGHIGRKIARRLVAFDVEVAYHARRRVDDAPHPWFEDLHALATWADDLVVAAPGGPDTRHRVDARILAALGPQGFLVNVGRGSIVDTAALVEALASKTVAGAGLDVYEGEPEPPQALFPFDDVTITPHVAGSSPQAMANALALFLDNATRFFAGQAVRTPV